MALENAGQAGRMEPRMRAGGEWSSAECMKKAEVMLRKALLSQGAVAAMLEVILPEGGAVDRTALKAGDPNLEDIAISPRRLETMRSKLIDCMEWSHLAHDRIKEMISHHEMMSESQGVFTSLTISQIAASHVPASGLRRGETDQQTQQSLIDLLLSDEEHVIDQGGPNFTGLASLGLDHSEWINALSADGQHPDLPGAYPRNVLPTGSGPAVTSREVEHHSSSTVPEDATDAQRLVDIDDRRLGIASQGSRQARSKRDRDECSDEKEWGLPEYQKLRPYSAVDKKKGIPDDGHLHWKKYGSKKIESYTYPRGYYKCSKSNNCAARKRVTQTNNVPFVFEVAYKHEHTCSATSMRSLCSCTCNNCTTAPSPKKISIDVDMSPASKRRCMPHDAEAGSPDEAPRMLCHNRVQTEIASLMNADHGKSIITTLPAIEVSGCKTNLPMASTSSEGGTEEDQDVMRMQGVLEDAPYVVTKSDSAPRNIAEHDANPYLHQSFIDLTFTEPLFWPDNIDMDIDTMLAVADA